MKSVHLLGLDPGLATMGWTVIEFTPTGDKFVEAGVLRTEKSDKKRVVLASDDNLRRAREAADKLYYLFQTYQFSAICAESMSFPRSSSAAAKVAMVWGALAMLTAVHPISVVQASPQEVKKHLCGKRDASKEEVEAEVKKRYPTMEAALADVPKSFREHPYDAAAVLLTAMDKSELIRAIRNMAA